MKNTLSLTENCECTCVDNVADGTNSIFVDVDVGTVTNPIFKIWKNSILEKTYTLTVRHINHVEIPQSLFSENASITFQYLDDGYTGQVFAITFPNKVEGNLSVKKDSDYTYTAKYTRLNNKAATTVSVKVNSTTTGQPGTNASVTNVGDDENVLLDFIIPRGEKGDTPSLMINDDGHLIAIYKGDN